MSLRRGSSTSPAALWMAVACSVCSVTWMLYKCLGTALREGGQGATQSPHKAAIAQDLDGSGIAGTGSDTTHEADLTTTLAMVHTTMHFDLSSAAPAPLAYIGNIAESSHRVANEWLRVQEEAGPPERIPIILCRTRAELISIELQHGVQFGPEGAKIRRTGGYYEKVPMIAFVDNLRRRAEIAAHEPVHWAIARITAKCPPVIDEGLAECAEISVLRGRQECADLLKNMTRMRAFTLAKVIKSEGAPVLSALFYVGARAFYSQRNYSLACCLGTVLCNWERAHGGTIRRLMEAYEQDRTLDKWHVFTTVYPALEIERAWRTQIDESIAAGVN